MLCAKHLATLPSRIELSLRHDHDGDGSVLIQCKHPAGSLDQ